MIYEFKKKIGSIYKAYHDKYRFHKNAYYVKSLAKQNSSSHKMIIDCGFNQGIIASRLLKELKGFSLIGFEVQQDIKKYSYDIKNKFPNRDIEIIYSAVSNRNGTIQYYEPSKWGKNFKGGTTIVSDKKSMDIRYDKPNNAPAIDFSEWLFDHITNDDFVFVKMDIEGAEYNVIDHLLNTGAIDLIDILAVEWHADKFTEPMRTKYHSIEKKIKNYADKRRIKVLDWY